MTQTMHQPKQGPADPASRIPHISEFVARLEEVDQSEYSGRCAELFFGSTGPGILKWLHYLPVYHRIFSRFQGSSVRFLEIGVLAGGSMHLWREYFGENATIFGIDINPECAGYGRDAGQVRIGSQDDPAFLRAVIEEMGGVDIVLDDGSHVASHQRASYDAVFPLLSDGGLYVIEDLHTSYWPDYEGGLKRPGTGLEFLKDLIDQMHRHYFESGANRSESMIPIQSIQFFDSIAVIERRTQQPRKLVIAPSPPPPPEHAG